VLHIQSQRSGEAEEVAHAFDQTSRDTPTATFEDDFARPPDGAAIVVVLVQIGQLHRDLMVVLFR
jgi:hypothetical protein